MSNENNNSFFFFLRQLCGKENMVRSAKKPRIEIVKRDFRSPTKETNNGEKTQTPKSRRKWVTPTFDDKMKAKSNFDTPVMLKLPANKLQTPFQRKKTKKELVREPFLWEWKKV